MIVVTVFSRKKKFWIYSEKAKSSLSPDKSVSFIKEKNVDEKPPGKTRTESNQSTQQQQQKHKKRHTKQRERQLPVYKHALLFLSHPARSIHLWNHTRLQNTIPHQNEKDTVDRSAESGK